MKTDLEKYYGSTEDYDALQELICSEEADFLAEELLQEQHELILMEDAHEQYMWNQYESYMSYIKSRQNDYLPYKNLPKDYDNYDISVC